MDAQIPPQNLLLAFPGSLRTVNEVQAVADVEALFKQHKHVNEIDIFELTKVTTMRRPVARVEEKEPA